MAKEKLWLQDLNLKRGRFTAYCKRLGYKGVTDECIERGLKSKDPSVRGMAALAKRFRSGEFRRKIRKGESKVAAVIAERGGK